MTYSIEVKQHVALVDMSSPAGMVFTDYYRYRDGDLSSPHFILFI